MQTIQINNAEIENFINAKYGDDRSTLINDFVAFVKTKIAASNRPQAAIDIQKDIEAYHKGELETTPLGHEFWSEMDTFIDGIQKK
jgi:hypothetical protein